MARAGGLSLLGTVIVAGLASAPAPARAEFQIGSPEPEETKPTLLNPQAPSPRPRNPAATRRTETKADAKADARVPSGAVRGFGEQVPLTFAVRQIVPSGMRTTYGAGVNPEGVVDWVGGQGWQETLRAAVRPWGLSVTVRNRDVSITR